MKASGAFHVLTDGYVTEESGTGVVHQAPYFGEDDYRVCLSAGVITKDMDMVCPVDASGRFTEPVTHFKGQYVKVSYRPGRVILRVRFAHVFVTVKNRGRGVTGMAVRFDTPSPHMCSTATSLSVNRPLPGCLCGRRWSLTLPCRDLPSRTPTSRS